MADIYSQQIYIGHAVNSDHIEVPAGFVAVIMTISVFAPGVVLGGTAQLTDEDSDATIWWTKISPDFAGVYICETDLRLVLPTGKRIAIIADAGTGEGVDMTINGYALSAP